MRKYQERTIRVFIGSSNELQHERSELLDFISLLNVSLNLSGITIMPVLWENQPSSLSFLSRQGEYNDVIQQSDICIFLLWTQMGKYTISEIEAAYMRPERRANSLLVFFKDIDKEGKRLTKKRDERIESFRDSLSIKYGIWPSLFSHSDTLKAEVLLNLIVYLDDLFEGGCRASIKDSKVYIDRRAVFRLLDFPFVKNNVEYQYLDKIINTTKSLLKHLDPDDAEYLESDRELQRLTSRREEKEEELWNTALYISRLKSQRPSDRLKRAITLFEQGDTAGARAILNEEDIARDVTHYKDVFKAGIDLLEKARQNIQATLEEYLSKIESLTDQMSEGWVDEVKGLFQKCFELGEDNIDKEKYADLLSRCGGFYELIRDYTTALEYEEKALQIRLSIYDNNHPDILTSYNNLGNIYADLGDYQKALGYQFKALQIQSAISGEENSDVATLYNNISFVYCGIGDYQTALKYQLRALDIQKAISNEEDLDVATSYSNLGSIYSGLGDHQSALMYQEKALEIQRSILGENHPDVAVSYNNISSSCFLIRQYEKALEYQLKALEIRQSTLHENHPDLAISFNNIGNIYGEMGSYEKNLEYLNKALKILLPISGEKSPSVASLYNNFGSTYRTIGDYEKALDYQLKALEIQKSLFGENHPSVATSYNNVGMAYDSMKKYEQALEYLIKSLKIRETLFDENHPARALSYNNLGLVYGHLGDQKKSLEYGEKALEIRKALFGENDPSVATSYNNVGLAYGAMNNHKKGFEYLVKAMNIRIALFGENHSDVADSYENIGVFYYRFSRDYNKALDYLQKALKIRESLFGKDHPDTELLNRAISIIYYELGSYQKAQEFFRIAHNAEDVAAERLLVFGDSSKMN